MNIKQKGFSLLEVIVSVTIIMILTSMAAPNIMRQFDKAKESVVTIEIAGIKATLSIYYIDTGDYPTTGEGLQKLVDEGYYDKLPVDPYGNEYKYKNRNGVITVEKD